MSTHEESAFFQGHDGVKLDLFQALQDDTKEHAAVIVVHEVWGLEDNIKSIARRFADLGYNVFAPHLYTRFGTHFTSANIQAAMQKFFSIPETERWTESGMNKALQSSSAEQKQIIQQIFASRDDTTKVMVKDLVSLVEYISSKTGIAGDKIGSIGFCLGGGLVFQLATEAPIKATSVFYGANPEPLDSVSKIKGEIIASYAAEDPRVNEGIAEMMNAFIKIKKEIEVKIYANAKHAFFNDLRPTYNSEAASDAWQRTVSFFSRVLG